MEKEIKMCARCKKHPELEKQNDWESYQDLRHLRVRCGYKMTEFVDELTLDKEEGLFTMWICKPCRSEFLLAFDKWFKTPNDTNLKIWSDLRLWKNL